MESSTPTTDDVTALEQDLLTAIETVAAEGALTDDDRHLLSYEAEMLGAELRGCIEHAEE
jgi:hypothetical protein